MAAKRLVAPVLASSRVVPADAALGEPVVADLQPKLRGAYSLCDEGQGGVRHEGGDR